MPLNKATLHTIVDTQFPLIDYSENADVEINEPNFEALNELIKDLPIMASDLQDNINMRLKLAIAKCPCPHNAVDEKALSEILTQGCQAITDSLAQYNFSRDALKTLITTAIRTACQEHLNPSALVMSRPQVSVQNPNNEVTEIILACIDGIKDGMKNGKDKEVIESVNTMAEVVRANIKQLTKDEVNQVLPKLQALYANCKIDALEVCVNHFEGRLSALNSTPKI